LVQISKKFVRAPNFGRSIYWVLLRLMHLADKALLEKFESLPVLTILFID
jgi:hypothetical protein